jgi:hypothetical protein
MRRACLLALAIAAQGCGAPCADDRCSLSPTTPLVQRTDYVNRPSPDAGAGPVAIAPSGNGSAAPLVAAGSGTAAPPPPGPGSAAPVAAGSGSAAPPVAVPPPPASTSWVTEGVRSPSVVSKAPLPASTTIKLEFVKVPEKTPFVVTLQTRNAGAVQGEAVWNECPENKIRCDASGTKSHSLKRAGQAVVQGGINWVVTQLTDEGAKTLVIWTNNLSREVLALRLSK